MYLAGCNALKAKMVNDKLPLQYLLISTFFLTLVEQIYFENN